MASRTLQVNITGDPSSFNRSMRGIDKSVDHSEGRMKRLGQVGKAAFAGIGLAAAAGAAVGIKKAADAAIEAEAAQSKMVTQLKAAGVSYKAHAKQIDEVIQKTSKLSGLDDEELQNSFTNIVRVTGDVNKSLKLTGLAADFARAKHMDVAKAGELVGKVAGGNTGILSRYGIVLKDGATASEALATLQAKFAGQAEAYGKTTQGALDRAGVASENLGEILGAKLTPLLARGADVLVDFVDKAGKLGGPIREVSGAVRSAYNAMVAAVRRFAVRNREDIQEVVQAARNLARFLKNVFEDVIVPIVKRLLPVFKGVFEGIVQILRGVIRIITGIVNGDWRRVWDGVKDIASGALKAVGALLKGLWGIFRDALKVIIDKGPGLALDIGKAIVRGLVNGLKGLATAVKNAIVNGVKAGASAVPNLLDKVTIDNPFGDGFGKIIGKSIMPIGGAFGGSLMGAQPALKPYAAMGSRFGLSVVSGRRPGDITSTGNPSYHGTGEAIDMSGSSSGMMAFARQMSARFRSRIAELIYTPLGGQQIWHGQPHVFTGGTIQRDHYDHVHVAIDTGRPGPGDGYGRRRARTGDGPGRVGTVTGSTGGIAGSPQFQRREKARGLLPKWWEAAKGFFPPGRRMPPTKFQSNIDTGALIYTSQHGRTFFPDWATRGLVSGNDAMFSTLIHEWAHAFQGPSVNTGWKAEGGATAFEKRVVPWIAAKLGMRFNPRGLWGKNNPYFRDTARVEEQLGEDWIMRGQFVGGHGRRGRSPLGKFSATAYGPPWNARNGTGVTAIGVDLRPAKKAFGIAVDPSRLKLGRNYYVWPNPFGRKGPFKAFDTGGGIKGNEIDFYDWRGRAKQLAWGRRAVTISSDPALNYSGGRDTGGGAPGAGGGGGGTAEPRKPRRKPQRLGGFRPPGGAAPGRGDPGLGRVGPVLPADPDFDPWMWNPAGAPAEGGDPNQGVIDAINAAAEAQAIRDEELKRLEEQRIAVTTEMTENQKRILAVATSQPAQMLAALVAAINGDLGGRVGLGYQTVGYAGATARY